MLKRPPRCRGSGGVPVPEPQPPLARGRGSEVQVTVPSLGASGSSSSSGHHAGSPGLPRHITRATGRRVSTAERRLDRGWVQTEPLRGERGAAGLSLHRPPCAKPPGQHHRPQRKGQEKGASPPGGLRLPITGRGGVHGHRGMTPCPWPPLGLEAQRPRARTRLSCETREASCSLPLASLLPQDALSSGTKEALSDAAAR